MSAAKKSHATGRSRYVVAMVVGTAFSALGTSTVTAENADPPHRAISDMSRYCTTCWKNARLHPDSWSDCTQEVFSRLLERVSPQSWRRALADEGEERKEFLRAIDTVKKRTQRARKFSPGPVDGGPDWRTSHERSISEEWASVREVAVKVLSPRQQQILDLSFQGWSVQEMAEELRLAPERISDEKYKAVRKLREHLEDDGNC